MATATATAAAKNFVWIDCPRCSGHGHRPEWHPDRGMCYRCRGKKEVRICVESHLAALRHLRAKYVSVKKLAAEGNELAAEFLPYVIQDGLRVRQDLEAAGITVP
jgi:hypothetical protein